mmetsp:Transcript_17547/g.26137  ORF Transcript_17547/g.26137 Transcript_17547/m.26137 type:complete len:169 (+) Transcript_17547:815-1321(+)
MCFQDLIQIIGLDFAEVRFRIVMEHVRMGCLEESFGGRRNGIEGRPRLEEELHRDSTSPVGVQRRGLEFQNANVCVGAVVVVYQPLAPGCRLDASEHLSVVVGLINRAPILVVYEKGSRLDSRHEQSQHENGYETMQGKAKPSFVLASGGSRLGMLAVHGVLQWKNKA